MISSFLAWIGDHWWQIGVSVMALEAISVIVLVRQFRKAPPEPPSHAVDWETIRALQAKAQQRRVPTDRGACRSVWESDHPPVAGAAVETTEPIT